jgi:hypothetical protein
MSESLAPLNPSHEGPFNKNADYREFDGREISDEENRIAAEKLRGFINDAREKIKE